MNQSEAVRKWEAKWWMIAYSYKEDNIPILELGYWQLVWYGEIF